VSIEIFAEMLKYDLNFPQLNEIDFHRKILPFLTNYFHDKLIFVGVSTMWHYNIFCFIKQHFSAIGSKKSC